MIEAQGLTQIFRQRLAAALVLAVYGNPEWPVVAGIFPV